jgi:flagellar biosynthesis chaperone FliJ
LSLKIVSANIRDLFNGNLTEFWQNDNGFLGDINELLQQQCDRLSNLEKDIMYWLALSRESIAISELQEKILGNIYPNQLLTEIQSLKQRSLVEKTKLGFTLQPVIMDFFTQKFIDKIDKEINTKEPDLLNSHAWLDACGKDYIKESQVKFFFTL